MALLPNIAYSQSIVEVGNWAYNPTPIENLCLLDGGGKDLSITFAFEQTNKSGIGGIGLSLETEKLVWTQFSIENQTQIVYFDIVENVYIDGLLTLKGDFDNPKDIQTIDLMYSSPNVLVKLYDENIVVSDIINTSKFASALQGTNECIVKLTPAL